MSSGPQLLSDEKVLAKSKHSTMGYVAYIGAGALFICIGILLAIWLRSTIYPIIGYMAAVICCVGGVLFALLFSVSLKSEQLIITNKRICGTKGFIAKRTVDIPLDKADTLNVGTSVLGCFFKYASLEIVAAGTVRTQNGNSITEKFSFLTNANDLHKVFFEAISKEETANK